MNISEDIFETLQKMQEDTEQITHKLDDTLNFSQIHCIHAIGNMEDPNVTKLAAELRMTTGAITKMCKKLFNENYTEKYQNSENNKEVYYKLTEKGCEIYKAHKVIHDKAYSCKTDIIDKYSDDEQTIILKFLKDICDNE